MSVIHAFLMAGQSNMAGRGFLNEVAPIKNPAIRMLRNGRWFEMSEPINYDRPFSGISLAASFAEEWTKDHPGEIIGLIPCADGGSSLADWMPGKALFDHMIQESLLAKREAVIDGILWHQGETDCDESKYPVYEEKLDVIISLMRKNLGIEEVPLMIGGLGDFISDCPLHDYFVNAPKINAALMNFAKTHQNCYYVTAQGLTSNPDMLHFSAISQRKFGRRYYNAYKNLRDCVNPLPNEETEEIEHILTNPEAVCKENNIEAITSALMLLRENAILDNDEYNKKMQKLIVSI